MRVRIHDLVVAVAGISIVACSNDSTAPASSMKAPSAPVMSMSVGEAIPQHIVMLKNAGSAQKVSGSGCRARWESDLHASRDRIYPCVWLEQHEQRGHLVRTAAFQACRTTKRFSLTGRPTSVLKKSRKT